MMAFNDKGTKISIIIPTLNAGNVLAHLLDSIFQQTLLPREVIIIDSESTDNTEKISTNFPLVTFIKIKRNEFNHGGTRDFALRKTSGDFVLFLTQDVVIEDNNYIKKLLVPFLNNKIVMVTGRQFARYDATEIEKLTREFNYPPTSNTRSIDDLPRLGIKTFFSSDVCSAYRRSAYENVGGFEKDAPISEDLIIAAKFIYAGYSIAYNADACVIHSHNLTLSQQYNRNKVIGMTLKKYNKYFCDTNVAGEGCRYVRYVLGSLIAKKHYSLLVYFIIECMAKFAGNQVGQRLSFRVTN